MKLKNKIFSIVLGLLVTVTLVSGVNAQDSNIVKLAQGNEKLSTLVTAVTSAGLADTLSDENASYTVFAPINGAFNKLPAGTVDTLLKPENKEKLTGILTYHVVDSAVMSGDLTDGQMVKTLNGQELKVSLKDDSVFIAGAKVVTADVKATNGVVHLIDSVLMPKAEEKMMDHKPAETGFVSTTNNSLITFVIALATVGSLLVFTQIRLARVKK